MPSLVSHQAERIRHCDTNHNKLYEIGVVERDRNHLKVHYVGYSDEYDEWKEAAEIVHNVDLAETLFLNPETTNC